jgi:hypothetical protein
LQNLSKNFEYAVSKAVSKPLAGIAWPVYEDYEVDWQGGDVFINAPFRPPPDEPGRIYHGLPEDLGLKRYYAPLRDYPDLFLRFASLFPKSPPTMDETLEVVLTWARNYGVLGLELPDHLKIPGHFEGHRGRWESLRLFSREIRNAARVLEFYEAATAPGGPDEQLTETLARWDQISEYLPLDKQREYALHFVSDRVGTYVRNECYPILWRTTDTESNRTLGFAQSLGFHSLLGAMYLQMMWLMTAGESARRCERPGCPRIVTFEPPQPPNDSIRKGARGKYRTRKDKKYCSDACRQWVYDHARRQRP